MPQSKVTFVGNPWPEGHAVKDFVWTARLQDGQVWFDFHLKTEDYDALREIDDEGNDHEDSWLVPAVWGNYHACMLSSTKWHDDGEGGFPVAAADAFSWDRLDGLEVRVDDEPSEDYEQRAFFVYLLGHDSTAHHRIRFTRAATEGCFDIHWVGKLALTYGGDDEYRHDFEAQLFDIPAPPLPTA